MLTVMLLSLLAVPPMEVEIFVPLCDNALIECGRPPAGAPRALETNLYWGAMYGAERFLLRAPGFKMVSREPGPDGAEVLRELVLERTAAKGERPVRLRLHAYAGDAIDTALEDFLRAAAGASRADLIVWAGHDRLMDREPPRVDAPPGATPRPVVVLACMSEQYFGPVLKTLGASPIALTRTLMAPEAYLLEALASTVARHGPTETKAMRTALVEAYARYQRLSLRAAGSVFSKLPPVGGRAVARDGPLLVKFPEPPKSSAPAVPR
ncbi:hypothetical protein POL68_35425 [Stigmatella sp. ncwal1]|uniref:Uncharacterized protein n=1 Tax=Stigmatella ashevillensis TaxID=2995309 RepID=A0ABT5DJI8_9BACT|nr:hypothetical protein [Stigmatella ashevillena]MDC0713812.1 hypothetical protein [Stigmatella ashevillena]